MIDDLIAYTDYPLFKSEYGKPAPVRQVKPLSYDGDKYVRVEFDGEVFSLKSGYLYRAPHMVGEGPVFDVSLLPAPDTPPEENG